MDCLKVNDEIKAVMRHHIEQYLLPFMFKGVLEMLENHIPIPENHPLYAELQKDFENLHNILVEGIANIGEDFYSDYETSGLEYIRSIMNGDLSFYYPTDENGEILTFKHDEVIEKRNEFFLFMFIQYFRTVGMRNVFQNNIHAMIKLIKDYEIKNKRRIGNFVLDNIDGKNLVPHLCLLFAGQCTDAFLVRNPHLTVFKNETSEMFLTSDQPVINLESKNDGSMPDEFVLYYPLSPTIAITVNDDNTENVIVINDNNIIRQYNEKLVKEAHVFVISDNEEQLRGL